MQFKLANKLFAHSKARNLFHFSSNFSARILLESFGSFRKFCMDSNNLSAELCTVIIAVQNGSRDVSALIPSFLDHVHQIYPHLAYEQDLQNISNMTMPAKWYPDARKSNRKIIFHAGPTNSGKTYNALKRFLEAKSGVYCGPLKMLASEIFSKSNEMVCGNYILPFM